MIVKTSGDFPDFFKDATAWGNIWHYKVPVEIWCEIPSDMFVAALII